MKEDIKTELQKFFKGEVEDSMETLSKYSRDASVFVVRPAVVVFPKDSQDVQNLVKWVNENSARQDLAEKYGKLSITARCAGTDMSGGAIGESIIMDFTRHMNKLIGGPLPLKNKSEWEIAVEPGMFYRDFEKITLGKGLILPCYTASKSINAMGGMFGNNSAGERTLKYGKTEDYILESKVVFADGNEYVVKPLTKDELEKKIAQNDFEGNVYKNIFNLIKDNEAEIAQAKPKVSKNSAGYYVWNIMGSVLKDSSVFLHPTGGTIRQKNPLTPSPNSSYFNLNKLLVGSQGTLGIATEITFKIIPDNKYSKLVAIFMNDLSPLGRLVDDILTFNPETLETYDDKTMKLAVRFFPDFLKNKGLSGMLKLGISFLPEFLMMLKSFFTGGGFPKLILLVEFAGTDEKAGHDVCDKLVKKIKNFKLETHITKSSDEADKYWDIRRESFALLRKHVKGLHTAPFIDDIIVRPEFLPKFIPELNSILNKYKLTYTLAGHAGDGNFHIIPLMDFKRTNTAQIIMKLSDEVYDLVLRYHGSITAEHNDGIIRTPYLNKMYEPHIIKIFSDIKQIFDVSNIFNPGKKVPTASQGGTKEYISTHIVLEK